MKKNQLKQILVYIEATAHYHEEREGDYTLEQLKELDLMPHVYDMVVKELANLKTFMVFRQNNSRGIFHPPARFIYVEANDKETGLERVKEFIQVCEGGFDDCSCCSCCGHRWDPFSPLVNGKDIEHPVQRISHGDTPPIALVKAEGGELIIGKTREDRTKIYNYLNS